MISSCASVTLGLFKDSFGMLGWPGSIAFSAVGSELIHNRKFGAVTQLAGDFCGDSFTRQKEAPVT